MSGKFEIGKTYGEGEYKWTCKGFVLDRDGCRAVGSFRNGRKNGEWVDGFNRSKPHERLASVAATGLDTVQQLELSVNGHYPNAVIAEIISLHDEWLVSSGRQPSLVPHLWGDVPI